MIDVEVKRLIAEDEVRRKIRLERRLAARVGAIFLDIRRQFRAEFAAFGVIPALRPHQDNLQGELETHYRVTQAQFAEAVPQALGITIPESARPVIAAGLASWASRRAPFQADVIITTVRKRFERAIPDAAATLAEQAPGTPPARSAIARVVANIMAPLMRRQATTVGQTETQPAAESTKQITSEALGGQNPDGTSGIPPVPPAEVVKLKKTWFTERDERVRPAHAAAEGQVRDVDQTFTVMGQSLMFPGDTSFNASLSNIVNCRCSALYEPRT